MSFMSFSSAAFQHVDSGAVVCRRAVGGRLARNTYNIRSVSLLLYRPFSVYRVYDVFFQ